MRLGIVNAVFRKELTELLRNRRSLLVMFGVPLLLYPTLTIAVASLTESKQNELADRVAQVAVVGSEGAPRLMEMLADPDNKIAAHADTAVQAEAELNSTAVDAVIIAEKDYQSSALAGASPDLTVKVDGSRSTTPSVRSKINGVLDAYQQWILRKRLTSFDVPDAMAAAPKHVVMDIATNGQTFGVFLASALPLLLLMTGMLGALYPALNATTTERELGTLETLLVTPATRGELLTAKAGIVLISGLLTALLNMVSMAMVLSRVLSESRHVTAGVAIDPWALTLSYIAAVPTLVFFTVMVLMVGLLARNLREANAYATPLMMVPIASMLIGIADPSPTTALLITPVANTTVIIRAVLTGHARFGQFALAFVSSGFYAGLVLSMTARLFTNEQLVNPAWEPISLRGLRRRGKPSRPRWPAVDEVLALFAVSLLLNFYLAPIWLESGLLKLVSGVEILLIALPALIFAWLGNYPWREVFSLRAPSWNSMAAGALFGVGLMPIMNNLSYLQQFWHILPANSADAERATEMFKPALLAHPFLAPIVVGALAGVCEELLFRGPIQAALTRRLPIGPALFVGGLLFAAAHVDLPGLPVRTILGIVLGWVVWRTGTIFPAMLLHAVYDGVSLAYAGWQLHRAGEQEYFGWAVVVGGAALCVVGVWLLRDRRRGLIT